MDVSSVNKPPVPPTQAVKRSEPPPEKEPNREAAKKPPEAQQSAQAAPRPVMNSQGHMTGRHLNVTA